MVPKGSLDFAKNILFKQGFEVDQYTYCIDKNKWENFNISFKLDKKKWRTVKFFHNDGTVNPSIKNVKDESGIFFCFIKPDYKRIPIDNFEFIMFIDGTTTSIRDALEDFVETKSSSYLHNTEIRGLFEEYEEYLYVSYYLDENINHVEELKEKLIDLINPPIKNYKYAEKGNVENGFE